MGVWSYPFQNIEKAKRFSAKMKKPWIAKVETEEEGFYRFTASGLGFLGSDSLYGDDSLWDYLGETSDKKKKDFDIRPYVEECLMYHIWYFEHQVDCEFDPKAIQLVHDSLKLKFTKKDIEPYVNELKEVLDTLKENKLKLQNVRIWAQDPKFKWTSYNMPIGVPSSHKTKKLFAIELMTDSKSSLSKILKEKFQIIKIAPFKTFTKKPGYTIFLEIKKESLKSTLNKNNISDKSKIKSKPKVADKSENIKNQYKMTCTVKGSNKFWNAKRVKNKVYLVFGPIGFEGRTTIKTFISEKKAVDFLADKVKEKLKKKYKHT